MQDLELDPETRELQFAPAALTGRGWVLLIVMPTQAEYRPRLYAQHEGITSWETKLAISEGKSYLYHCQWMDIKMHIQARQLDFPTATRSSFGFCVRTGKKKNSLPIKNTSFQEWEQLIHLIVRVGRCPTQLVHLLWNIALLQYRVFWK